MSTTTTTTTAFQFQTEVQYGFFFDQGRCINCRACVIGCRDWNNVPPGSVKYLKMFEWETGSFPNTRLNYLFAPCYHCASPVCVTKANGAMMKEPLYGAVLIDPSQASNPNLKAAFDACPYGAISFDSDSPTSNAFKCTMCIDRLSQNKYPICVEACPMRALDFDTVSNLRTKYGTNQQLQGMPDPGTTNPSVVFKPHVATKTQLVSYDANAALVLWQARPSPLPPFFNSSTDVTNPSGVSVGRSSLNMKSKSTEEFLYNTGTDEA